MINPFAIIKNWVTKSYRYLSKGTFPLFPFLGQPTRVFKTDNLDSYEVCWLVNACIDKIAEAVGSIEIKLFKVRKNEEIDEVKDHQVLDLLARPNAEMSGFEMFEAITVFLKLLGNAYILKLRGEKTQKIQALALLRPDWVRIFFENGEKKYEYTIGGQKEIFSAKDIIHIKQFNPKDPFYGLPTVMPLMETIKTLIFTTRWTMNFFYNSARPDALLISKTRIGDEEVKEFYRKWREQFGGWEKAHNIGLLQGDITYQQIQATGKEMQLISLDDAIINRILAAFGVPKPVLAMTTDLNRATAEAAIYSFMKFSVLPDIQRIFDKLNESLIPEFGDNLYLDYGDPVPEDREKIINEYSVAWNKWLTINEIRDREGLPPIDGGWTLYLPVTLMPAGETEEGKAKTIVKEISIDSKKYYKDKKEKEQERLRRKILPKLVKRKEIKLKNELKELLIKYANKRKELIFTEEQKRQIWLEHDKGLTSDTKMFRVIVRTLFKKQKERVKEAVSSAYAGKAITKAKIEIPINWDLEDRIFVEVSRPAFTAIAKRKAEQVAFQLGEEFTMTERMKRFIDRQSQRFARQVNETTWENIKEELKEGIEAGEGVSQLSNRIDNVYRQRLGYGSERIARTEVIRVSNEATLEAYLESEVVEKKEWLATMDERVRDTHAALNGEVRYKDEKFSNGLLYPGDPAGDPDETINCRCTLLPVIE